MAALDTLFTELLKRRENKSLPPVEMWQPESEGVIDISIDTDGCWFHEGREIKRQGLVDVFATVLRLDAGEYFLVTPVEKLKIEVTDVPFIGVDVEQRGEGASQDILITTNVGDYVLVDAQHPLEMRDEKPYVHVRGDMYARLTRPAFYRLVEYGQTGKNATGQNAWHVFSQGTCFDLGAV